MKTTTACLLISCLFLGVSCKQKSAAPSREVINQINLKRGPVLTCRSVDRKFGEVDFETSCGPNTKEDFNLALKLLHSFEYDEAEKVFAKVIDINPGCAMAYWGAAMANFHPLWAPPTEPELKKGLKAIHVAQSIKGKTKKEAAYINALAAFYQNWEQVPHQARCQAFEKAMASLHTSFPADKEAAIFYALALTAAAEPADKQFVKQKKAGRLLNTLYPDEPNHPGIIHYIIHTYDYPELAALALPAARKYASVAPASAHAQHMPSHIFTRLGLWEECIQSNKASIAAAQCYAETVGMKGHWDEELHGLDYLVYAYLQRGENTLAKQQWDYLKGMKEVTPQNFKVAYAYAAIPARYVLENKRWREAATLPVTRAGFSWEEYPWQKAIIHFTRLLGLVHTGNQVSATAELTELKQLRSKLLSQKDAYKANQVEIQIVASEAWLCWGAGRNSEALVLMKKAAELEDKTEKHPVTPSEVLPARELLGDMLLQMNQPQQALAAYEANLQKHPNRFNGIYGAGQAAEKSGNLAKAEQYYQQLLQIANTANSDRPELNTAKQFIQIRKSVQS